MNIELRGIRGIRTVAVDCMGVVIFLTNDTDYIPTHRGKVVENFIEYKLGTTIINIHNLRWNNGT